MLRLYAVNASGEFYAIETNFNVDRVFCEQSYIKL